MVLPGYHPMLAASVIVLIGCIIIGATRIKRERKELPSKGLEDTSARSMLLETSFTEASLQQDCPVSNLADFPDYHIQEIKKMIIDSTGRLCKNSIRAAYAENSVATASAVVVAMQLQFSSPQQNLGNRSGTGLFIGRTSTLSARICGFATLKERPGSIHVDLLCSPEGYGQLLLEKSERHGVTLNKRYADLAALGNVKGFYEKLGYRHCVDPCSDMCVDEPVLTEKGFLMNKCLDATPASTKYTGCVEGPCLEALALCKNEHLDEIRDCIDAVVASLPCSDCKRCLETGSSGSRVMKDITSYFVGKTQGKRYRADDGKSYRCCCTLENMCHLIVEGRNRLPFKRWSGFRNCGTYIRNSHSWNYWFDGECRIDLNSLNDAEHAVFNPPLGLPHDNAILTPPSTQGAWSQSRPLYRAADYSGSRYQGVQKH